MLVRCRAGRRLATAHRAHHEASQTPHPDARCFPADEGAADVAAATATPRAQRESVGRKPLPDHLEREERVHLPASDGCPDCGGLLKPLDEEVAEQLEYVRAHFRMIRHRRPELACVCCDRIVRAASQARRCSRTLPCRSSRTTSRCTAKQSCMRATASISTRHDGLLDGQHRGLACATGRRCAPLRAGRRQGSSTQQRRQVAVVKIHTGVNGLEPRTRMDLAAALAPFPAEREIFR